MNKKSFIQTTEENLSRQTMIKNAINPYIVFRLDKTEVGSVMSEQWINDTIEGVTTLLESSGIDVNTKIAREHVVNYVLTERGIGAFGLVSQAKL